jgi:hypothetical protein
MSLAVFVVVHAMTEGKWAGSSILTFFKHILK